MNCVKQKTANSRGAMMKRKSSYKIDVRSLVIGIIFSMPIYIFLSFVILASEIWVLYIILTTLFTSLAVCCFVILYYMRENRRIDTATSTTIKTQRVRIVILQEQIRELTFDKNKCKSRGMKNKEDVLYH